MKLSSVMTLSGLSFMVLDGTSCLVTTICVIVRPDMRYCFRSGRFRPNPRTKHISVAPRHMTKSYIPDFNMISQHYRYKDTISHTIGTQLPEYNISAEDTCL